MSNVTSERRVEGDWWADPIPPNVHFGAGFYCETAQIFRFLRSRRADAVSLGEYVSCYAGCSFAIGENGRCRVGDFTLMNGALVMAEELIEIGSYCLISWNVGIADSDYRQYLRMQIGKSATECLHATFVTHDWAYLGDERMASGTPGQVDSNLRGLLSRAFDLGASGIILAHNHPSGSSEPSAADISLTQRIAAFTRSVDIVVLDHLIVGEDDIVSMKERGLL